MRAVPLAVAVFVTLVPRASCWHRALSPRAALAATQRVPMVHNPMLGADVPVSVSECAITRSHTLARARRAKPGRRPRRDLPTDGTTAPVLQSATAALPIPRRRVGGLVRGVQRRDS